MFLYRFIYHSQSGSGMKILKNFKLKFLDFRKNIFRSEITDHMPKVCDWTNNHALYRKWTMIYYFFFIENNAYNLNFKCYDLPFQLKFFSISKQNDFPLSHTFILPVIYLFYLTIKMLLQSRIFSIVLVSHLKYFCFFLKHLSISLMLEEDHFSHSCRLRQENLLNVQLIFPLR